MKRTLLLLIYIYIATTAALFAQPAFKDVKIKPVGKGLVLRTTVLLDDVRLKSNAQHIYTPVLEGKGGETTVFPSIIVNGRRQHLYYERNGRPEYPNAYEVARKNNESQSLDYLATVPYEAWMDGATLSFATDTCGCGNITGHNGGMPVNLDFHPERGICFAFLAPPATAPDPIVSLAGRAYLDYPVNRTELYPEYRNNPRELHKIVSTIDTVRNNPKVSITAITIHGYASPEGPWDNNVRLSKGRAATLKDYVRRLYSFDENLMEVRNTPEDWAGLDSFLVASNMDEKEAILRIVRDESIEPDARNERIRKEYPDQYRTMLAAWYPALRHSDYTVSYKIRPMTDEEAAELIKTQPSLLSLSKMYRIAALYEPGSDDYNEVFNTAVAIYPNDPVANVNAANIALGRGDLVSAERFLEKAGDSPEADHARGLLALLNHKLEEARFLLERARAGGIKEAETNLQILQKMN